MKLSLTRTGGFAGLRHEASVDAAALPAAERAELLRLVAEAELSAAPPAAAPARPAPDRFRYRLVAQDGERRWELSVAEEALPEPLRRLIRWVEERSGRR